MVNTIIVVVAAILLLPGIVGVFLPILPSLPYMGAIVLIYLIFDRFQHLTAVESISLLLIVIISLAVDYFSGILGAKYGGASKRSTYIGFLGMIIGLIFLPPFGGFAGLFIGILVGEFLDYKKHMQALKAATSGLIGSLAGIVINVILAFLFIGLFIIFALY
jgi:hypothetical protein